MPYPRARLLAGVVALLLMLLGCLALLSPSLSEALGQVIPSIAGMAALLTAAWLLVQLPMEWIGGHWLPTRYARSQESGMAWLIRWGKASLVQGLFFWLNLMMLPAMYGWIGWIGALGWLFVSMLMLMGFQLYLHIGLTWAQQTVENHQGRLLFVMEQVDRGFTGGIFGVPGKESIVYPRYWRDRFSPSLNQFMINHRHGAINTGAHGRGVLLAFGWNLLLFAGALFLSQAPLSTAAGLLQTVGWFSLLTLTSRIGLLPWLSRRAVYEVDHWTYFKGLDPDLLREGMRETERLLETASLPGMTSIQSQPSASQRDAIFSQQTTTKGAWQATRQANFCSWAGGNLLCRVWPDQLGRPELWVYSPGE